MYLDPLDEFEIHVSHHVSPNLNHARQDTRANRTRNTTRSSTQPQHEDGCIFAVKRSQCEPVGRQRRPSGLWRVGSAIRRRMFTCHRGSKLRQVIIFSIQCGSRGSRYPPRRSTMAMKSPCRHHQRTIRRCTAKVSRGHHLRRGLNRRQSQAPSLNFSKVTLLPGRVSSGPDRRTTRLLRGPHRRLCPQLRIRRPGLWSPSMGTSMQWSVLCKTLRSKWRRLELGDAWPR